MHAVTPRHAASTTPPVMSARGLQKQTGRDDRDGPLVEALRRRDADAAERLVTTYQSRAYRLAVGITANAEDAEEVVQDAFLSAIRKIDTFRGESARRRQGRRIDIALEEVLPAFDGDGRHAAAVVDWSAAVDDPSRHIEIRLAVRSALDELPHHYRAALIMRDVENLSCAEIAEVLHLSVGGAKTRAHRARLFIRKRLAESLSGRSSLGPAVESPD